MDLLPSKSNFYFFKIVLSILLIGIGAGVCSFLFHHATTFLFNSYFNAEIGLPFKFFISSILVMISLYLTRNWFFNTEGSGIPQVKLSLVVNKGIMPRRMPIGKFVTSLLTLSSGLSFGKEGPLVTMSAAWASFVSQTLGIGHKATRVLVSSGATAGLAAAFNTPIAAVVFTIEEILGEINSRYLGTLIIASVVASVTSFELSGGKSTFVKLDHGYFNKWHLFYYLILGFIASFSGIIWVKLTLIFKKIRSTYFSKKYSIYVYLLLVTAITYWGYLLSPQVFGDEVNFLNKALLGYGDLSLKTISLLFIIKFFLASAAYSTGLSGGLFMPVLFLGSAIGILFGGVLMALEIPGIKIEVFALLGMASFLVAVIRVPFTALIMIFEMTRDYSFILPLMVTSVAAYWCSVLMNPESIYESVAEYEGVHLPTESDNDCLNEMTIQECMTKKVVRLESAKRLSEIVDEVAELNYSAYPVYRGDQLLGVVGIDEIKKAADDNDQQSLGNITRTAIISIYPDQSLVVAMDKMKRFDIHHLIVLSRLNRNQILGIITPRDIINYLGFTKKYMTN